MSRIPDLGKHHAKLPDILDEYEQAIGDAEALIKIKGKKLENANIENPAWQHYYDQKRIELYTLVKYFEQEVQRVKSKLFRSFKENHSIELSEREISRYIESEKAYLDMNELYLEVKELYEKYQGIVNDFTTRGYALNNITKIRVASLEDVEL